MSIQQIKQRIDGILAFMHPHWDFVNCHMVNYITDKHWEKFVPGPLRSEVENVEAIEDCIETVFWRRNEINDKSEPNKYKNFIAFLQSTDQYRLDKFTELIIRVEDLNIMLAKRKEVTLSIKEFMTAKKRHEVELTANLINNLIQKYNKDNGAQEVCIVDAGDGKGYLSSRLALQYSYKVLGIDGNEANTINALERSSRLKRAWNTLQEKAKLEVLDAESTHIHTTEVVSQCSGIKKVAADENYKTSSMFITADLNLESLISDFYPSLQSLSTTICLSGLHTCGNLAPTCLKVFHKQSGCKILCNVGCCYHLLKERFASDEFFKTKMSMPKPLETDGFPMSNYLVEKRVALGRNARMLAAQSIERVTANKELPNVSLYYRALLEVLICELQPHSKNSIQVGKVRKFVSFKEYVRMCANKVNFDIENLDACKIDNLEQDYRNERHFLNLFYLIRMTFAPVIETLILLDRLLYLKENGYRSSYLVVLFDAIISPRRYAVVAMKNSKEH